MNRRLIALLRAVHLVLHLTFGLALATVYPWFNQTLRGYILQCWSRNLLRIFNVRVEFDSDKPQALRRGLIVANHISWLDVFVLNAVVPMRFVAKSEVRGWPVIGWLCMRAQTLFIERGNARSAARMNVQLVKLLQRGECLAIFPEGTTTDGTKVAHFHSSLLQPAIDAGAPVHPVSIRYQDGDGAHNMVAAYIDDLSFGASLWSILSTPQLHVKVIATSPLDACAMDRRTLTRAAHERISATLLRTDSSNLHISLTAAQHSADILFPSPR